MAPGSHTPSDDSLRAAVRQSKELGLRVGFKPHLQIGETSEWRARVTPSDRNAWFRSYGDMLVHYGKIAEEEGVEQMVIGTELINMASSEVDPGNAQAWRDMISRLRAVYSGKLTYSANWGSSGWYEEISKIGFWDALDFVGISAYFYMTDTNSPALEALMDTWDSWNATHIRPVFERTGKPVVFTEIGYRSMDGALKRPPQWDQTRGGPDPEEQALGYRALLSYWSGQDFMGGVHFWDWHTDPNAGGPQDVGFTPQNKPAETVITDWFGGGAPAGEKFSFRTSVETLETGGVGEETRLRVNVQNLGSAVRGLILDTEIYDSSGTKVGQMIYPDRDLDAGGAGSVELVWIPSGAGDYRLKLGIFGEDWSELMYWQDRALDLFVASEGSSGKDIVLYAGDAPRISGAWSKIGDPSAAGGYRLYNENRNLPKAEVAAAEPADHFEMEFEAEAGTPYHLWLRMRADGDFYGNDSVHVQFSDSLDDSGAVAYRIGSSGSLAVVLEEGRDAGLSGWGWNDDHYGALGTNIRFARPGLQSLRIQSREDGVSIDQIVLSPSVHLARRPGATKNDTLILPGSLSETPPPPPEPGSLDIWWPEDGVSVSGLQPWKALVQDLDPSEYRMFWQVDGDRLNPMFPSDADYPHQEAWVDVSSWNWRDSGPYLVNFVAQAPDGRVLREKAVNIMIQ